MSHTSKYAGKITDAEKFCEVAKAKGYDVRLGEHVVDLYGSNNVKAVASVLIDGWRYRVAINEKGEMLYDHFGSQSGTMELMGGLVQDYNEALTMPAIPYDELEDWQTVTLDNGDKKLILEYAE